MDRGENLAAVRGLASLVDLLRPASVQPQPLRRPGAHPALQTFIYLRRQRERVATPAAGVWQRQWRFADQAEAGGTKALDMARHHRAAEAKRIDGCRRRGHRRVTEERDGDTVVHLLIDQDAEIAARSQV